MKEIICTKETPWNKIRNREIKVVQPDAEEISQRDGYPCGDYIDYKCPNCGHEFSVELPQ